MKRRLRYGRRRFGRSKRGYVRCSGRSVLRRMQACFWRVCSEMSNVKLVGCAQRPLAILALGGSRRSSVAMIGMLMACAISCAIMSSSNWQMMMRCLSSTRLAFSSRATRRAAWRGNTPVRQARLRTARSGFSLPTFHVMAMRSSIARCIFRKNGSTIQLAWKPPTFLPIPALRPNQSLLRE